VYKRQPKRIGLYPPHNESSDEGSRIGYSSCPFSIAILLAK
jgi:hypothetical protein